MQACRKQVVKQMQKLETADSQTRLSGVNFVPEPADWDLGFGTGIKGGKSFHSAGNLEHEK